MIDASIYKYFNIEHNGEFQGLANIVKTLQNMINAGIDPNTNMFIKVSTFYKIFKGTLTRLRDRGYLILRKKANILVKKAARLIGISDEYDVLRENGILIIIYSKRYIALIALIK